MSDINGAIEPDDAGSPDAGPAPGGPGGGGPPQGGGGGLLAALRQQQQGPAPSTPGAGNQANSLLMLKNAIDLIQQSLSGLDAGSQPHRDALNALRQLSRHLPQGAPTAGVQQTQMGDLLRTIMRSALLQRLRGQQGGAGQGGPGGPQPPMPSTPLPGA